MQDDEPKTERIITPMSTSLLDRIDEWRYANRIASRTEAIRQLLADALHAGKAGHARRGMRPKVRARGKK